MTSRTISYLRFPLTVGVVLIHFNLARDGLMLHGVAYGLDNPDWYRRIVYFFSEVLASISVPLFFLISGYLFFYQKEDFTSQVYVRKLKKRARTLLVPFILWNVIALLNLAVRMLPAFSSLFPNLAEAEFHFSLSRLFHTFFADNGSNGILVTSTEAVATYNPYPLNVPMWYIRDLMLIVLFTPAIYWFIRKAGPWSMLVLGTLMLIAEPLLFPEGYFVLLTYVLFFFCWGAYYSIHRLDLVGQMRRLRFAPLVFVPFAIADTLTRSNDQGYIVWIHDVALFSGIVSVVVATSYLLERGRIKVNQTLADSSFFIFALHTLIIDDLGKAIFVALGMPDNAWVMLAIYFLVPAVTILLCLTLYIALRRYMPALCSLLTGGR